MDVTTYAHGHRDGPHRPPHATTSFIGRAHEMRSVHDLFERHRLVTLAGPGGAGKTRLALEVAHTLAADFSGDVAWVELAGLTDGSAVAHTAAVATGAPIDPRRGPLASLSAQLSGRRTLLCLDNAEHLLDNVADVAAAALRAGPEVAVLVTSREPLRLAGEQVWRVPPLAEREALELFIERARLVRPDYQLDATRDSVVRAIVRHLDGIPLALELAAGWLGVLSAEQVLTGLDDRFRLLIRGPRNVQRRQQTMVGSIDWSYALLTNADRTILRRLSIFSGSFSLGAAEAVVGRQPAPCEEILAALARLVDKSLVMIDEHAGQVRYRLLETIRVFAAARLAEEREGPMVRTAHLQWHLEFAEAADAWRELDPDRWLTSMQMEYADLRSALEWALDGGDPEAGRRLAGSMAWLWHLDPHGGEGYGYLRRAIDIAPDDRSIRQALLLTGLALVVDTTAPLDAEYDAATRALDLASVNGDRRLQALCLTLAAVGAFYTDFDEAWALAEQAAATAPDLGLAKTSPRALQAMILHHRDQHADADAILGEVLPTLRRQHRGIAATALTFQALGALATGELGRATRLGEEAFRLATPLGDYLRVGMARTTLATVHTISGDLDAAQAMVEPLLGQFGADGAFIPGLPYALGMLAMHRDQPLVAVEWFQQGAAATDRGADSWIAAQSLAELGALLATHGAEVDATAALERAVETAARLDMPRVLATARLAQADLEAVSRGRTGSAVDIVHEALAIHVDHGLRAGQPAALEALARHGAALRPSLDAAQLLGAAEASRRRLGIAGAPHEIRRREATLVILRDALGANAVAAACAQGARLSLDEAVRLARRARGARGRPTSGWESLTPTELDVAGLVAQGLSNPEIANRLIMGRGTVKTHLSHIFSKLAMTNRTQLATLAASRLLDP